MCFWSKTRKLYEESILSKLNLSKTCSKTKYKYYAVFLLQKLLHFCQTYSAQSNLKP